jgi:UDP-galactopyranose mutase
LEIAQHPPVICFSHLRWDFVFQRPQHVLSRLAAERRVYYVEEPVLSEGPPRFEERTAAGDVVVLRPCLPPMQAAEAERTQSGLISSFLARTKIENPILWYYTPMPIAWTNHIACELCVYDCMDELSMFAFAPEELQERERRLLAKASIVFTGGRSLYYRKRKYHHNVKCFPSAVDALHFAPRPLTEPTDQSRIPRPRFGFYGVIDERFDRDYLDRLALLRPEWQFVIVGPTVKIDAARLPQRENIHYLGKRSYDELPAYLQHWDVAVLPFARNESTRYISPTKTLEYLAARKPVISTPIADVVDPYGEEGLVAIGSTPEEFISIAEKVLQNGLPAAWYDRVSRLVQTHSWDATVAAMRAELHRAAVARALA